MPAPFTPLFSERVWRHAQLLLAGAILATGKRTVSSALRADEFEPSETLSSPPQPGHVVNSGSELHLTGVPRRGVRPAKATYPRHRRYPREALGKCVEEQQR